MPADWAELMRTVANDPFDSVAENVLHICSAHAAGQTFDVPYTFNLILMETPRFSASGRLSHSPLCR